MADAEGVTLVTVASFGLGVQAWAGEDDPVPDRLLKPRSTSGPTPKPDDGFFTSTWRAEKNTTAWIDHMRANGLRTGSGRRLWTLVANPEATLYVIDCKEDYENLTLQYPNRWDPSVKSPVVAPDWNRIANNGGIDGVHVSAAAASSSWLWRWDVESTLWMRWSFVGEPECVADIGEGWEVSPP